MDTPLKQHVSISLRERIVRNLARAKWRAQSAWQWIRFGTLTEKVRAVDSGVASEIEFLGRRGKVVGFWAYGSFDPSLPYQG